MTIKKRGEVYWMDFAVNGQRVRESTGTGDKKAAQELHDKRRAEVWAQRKLGKKPSKTVTQAFDQWVIDKAHKRTLCDDQDKIDYLTPRIGGMKLQDVTREVIEANIPRDRAPATRNRYRAFIRSVLRAAEREWEWIDRAPVVKNEQENNRRFTCLTQPQAEALIAALPDRYAPVVRFALLTGLRKSNILELDWKQVNLDAATVVVREEDSKSGRRIIVPLNTQAIALLRAMPSRWGNVFGVQDIISRTWHAACVRAGLEDFHFHDLRHTWASWHAMAGTPMQVLQELGGWQSPAMLQRYVTLSSDHLREQAERVALLA